MDERKKKRLKGFLLIMPALSSMAGWLILFFPEGFNEKVLASQPIETKIIANILACAITVVVLIAFFKGYELLEESEEKCCEKISLGSV